MIKIDFAILIQFINFIVLLVLLNAILYKPLRKLMRERQESIAGGHSRARDLEGSIEEKMNRYQDQLQEAKLKANQERAELRKAATTEESSILHAAHDEATSHLQQIKNQVAAEATSARQALLKETDALAGAVAAKVLGRSL